MQSELRLATLGLAILLVCAYGNIDAQGRDASGDQIEAAWGRLYNAGGEKAPEPKAAESSPWWYDYVTLNVGGTYEYQAVDFSGDPTVSFVVDREPAEMVTPAGFSFPQVLESSDHKFKAAGALSTHGLGHERVNTYISTVLRHDLDGLTLGSPFQSILDDHGGERVDLSNAFVELNGLAARGLPSSMSIRIGRQFIPDFRVGLLGSPVIDGARLGYQDEQTDVKLFIGRWEAFYQDVSEVLVAGGRFSHQLASDPAATFGLEPYVDFLYFRDTEHDEETYRAVFGLNARWHMLDGEVDLAFIDGAPTELNLRVATAFGKLAVYSYLRKRLSDDDFTFDIFLTADDLTNRGRLRVGRLSRATEFTIDADYELLSWLVVGAGLWINALDQQRDQTGFQADFQEVNGRLVIQPPGPISGALQYRYRHVDRGSNRNVTLFDDTSRTGETEYHELNAELRYRWKGRLRVLVGGYYGIYDTQSQYSDLDDSEILGAYARTHIQVSPSVRLNFHLGVDQGNDAFNPDIDFQYTAQAGIRLYY